MIEGKLQIEDLTGEESAYFLLVTHGGNFILETKASSSQDIILRMLQPSY